MLAFTLLLVLPSFHVEAGQAHHDCCQTMPDDCHCDMACQHQLPLTSLWPQARPALAQEPLVQAVKKPLIQAPEPPLRPPSC
ncbi:hypothetical protein B3C1_09862 [Gallaecimonas xiamenensis 3-C-1]|uniref:Uncharacterized protein n=1 Tax=Gallaecimonas xiamenensis 3-C-1 TaxID=745411 RepID=K2JTK8_9GAMM|nr:hypothetical protein B3C1_09862 [Gallaecimonas xiamenensis 3-C-1]